LNGDHPLAGDGHFVDALDFGIFLGQVIRSDPLSGAGLEKGQNEQDTGEPAEKGAAFNGHGLFLSLLMTKNEVRTFPRQAFKPDLSIRTRRII
jgi:hypothetical protein